MAFTIEIDGHETECELNFGSALDYELEFGSDMVADVNGSVEKDKPEFITFSEPDKDGNTEIIGIDFSAVPWTTLIKVLWVAVKTANPKTKGFDKWVREARGINMIEARGLISMEMEDCFFRNAPVDDSADGAEQQ
jgi:hypothetical protein